LTYLYRSILIAILPDFSVALFKDNFPHHNGRAFLLVCLLLHDFGRDYSWYKFLSSADLALQTGPHLRDREARLGLAIVDGSGICEVIDEHDEVVFSVVVDGRERRNGRFRWSEKYVIYR